MDTSETYIKMCDCPEIQGLKVRDARGSGCGWDFIYNYEDWDGEWVAEDGEVSLHCAECNSEYGGKGLMANAIWLPTQSQLQEMVYGIRNWNDTPAGWALSFGQTVSPEIIYTQGITEVYDRGSVEAVQQHKELEERYLKARKNQAYWRLFTSMEQLWLAFVMRELHQKVWDGERWINES